jgi:hypothetical protein
MSTDLKGGPLVKLVKGEGCATRVRARSLAAPRRGRGRDEIATALRMRCFVSHVDHNLLY